MNEIDAEIAFIKDRLEFLKILDNMLKMKATGYEMIFRLENLKQKLERK